MRVTKTTVLYRPVGPRELAVHRERWISAEDLDAFADAIVGPIELIASYPDEDGQQKTARIP
jgi:hypothetical protein